MTAEVRAQCLVGVTAYLNKLPTDLSEQIQSGYSPEVRRALQETQPNVFFPIEYWKEAIDGVVALQPDVRKARQEVSNIGVCICEGTVNSFLRLLMRIMNPTLFAKKCGNMIGRDFRGFPAGAEPEYTFDERENEITMTVKGAGNHIYLGGTGRGFVAFAFEYMGKKNVVIDEPGCADDDWAPDVVSWRVRWS